MAEFKRDQFKGTSTKTLKTLKEQEDALIGTSDNAGYLSINEGMNKIRIAPKFPHEKEYYLMSKRTWLPFEKDDGEMVRMPIYDSVIHGGTKKDIIQEYFNFAKANLDPNKSGHAEKLKTLTDWKEGLIPQIMWRAYGWKLEKEKEPKFGIFEFKKTVRDELNSLSIIEDEDEAIDIDPFTDIDEGTPILLTYNPKAKKASDYYNVKMSKNPYPLTDEMFEELTKQKPLTELFRDCYTLETFEKALDGLRIYDTQNEIDLFDEGDFQEIIVEVRKQYASKTKTKQVEVEEEEDETPKKVEEEDEAPKKPKKPAIVEEEEEDEAPKKSVKKVVEEEEGKEPPAKKPGMSLDELRQRLADRKKKTE